MEGVEVGVLQLVAVPASSAVKRGIGQEIVLTLALGVEQGVVGEGEEVAGAGPMGVQQGGMEVHKGMEGPLLGALVLHLEHVTNVGNLDTGQTAARTDQCKQMCSPISVLKVFDPWSV